MTQPCAAQKAWSLRIRSWNEVWEAGDAFIGYAAVARSGRAATY